mmetsp:Transcript_19717/g.45176  ORF Transcript_19717/g.45176 Transcript_19717/m.45176 type:complete len:98 (-) Transcript_19717:62-355(-)
MAVARRGQIGVESTYLSAYRPHDRGRIRANSTYLYVGMSLLAAVAVARRGREAESESTRLTFMSARPSCQRTTRIWWWEEIGASLVWDVRESAAVGR